MTDDKESRELSAIIRTSTIFEKVLNALSWIFFVCACIAAGFALLSFTSWIPIEKLMSVSEISLDTGIVELNFKDTVINENPQMFLFYIMIRMMVPAAFSAAICRTLKEAIEPIKEGRPFSEKVADALKKIALIYLLGEVVAAVATGIAGTLMYNAYDLGHILLNEHVASAPLDIDADINILVPVLIYVISWIVRYGVKLQTLEDETL